MTAGQRVRFDVVHSPGSLDFDGFLRVYQDGQLIFDQSNVRTSYANCNYNAWCTSNAWSVNNYSDGLTPVPAVIYLDDAVIELP